MRWVDRSIIKGFGMFVGWAFLTSNGVLDGVLRMWDKSIVKNLEECGGVFGGFPY